MIAPTSRFLEDLRTFADAEGVRDADLARPMELLSDALGRVVPVEDHPALLGRGQP